MTVKILFSASTNGFYFPPENTDIPNDAVEITEENYAELFEGQSAGKAISSDKTGNPILMAQPLPTQEELVAQAIAKKATLSAKASASIAPLQYAVDLKKATDSELSQLAIWKEFAVALNRLDTSDAPNIAWPETPF